MPTDAAVAHGKIHAPASNANIAAHTTAGCVRTDDSLDPDAASDVNISLRTGCFCNPGTGEIVHHLTRDEMAQAFNRPEGMSFSDFFDWARREHGRNPSTLRISLGIASNFTDVYRFMHFLTSFIDKPETEIEMVEVEYPVYDLTRDSA